MARIFSIILMGLVLCGLLIIALRRRLFSRWMGLPPAQYRTTVGRRLAVPMPDGATLLADRYSPDAPGSFPTILIRSPWGRGWEQFPFSLIYMILAQRFAERGYHVLVQSVRIRPAVEALIPSNEAADGRATLAWIAEQPWFNGSLGLWGASYLGYVQWAVAADAPPFLKALVPITTTSDWRAFFFRDRVPAFERILHTCFITQASQLPFFKLVQRLRQQQTLLAQAALHLPPLEADTIVNGKPNPAYRMIFAHLDQDDPYWQSINQYPSLARVTAAAHLIGGWDDIFLRETLADYAALVAAGRHPYLTIGPWAHATSEASGTGLRQGLVWFDAYLKGRADQLGPKPVKVFIKGAEVWRDLDAWPPLMSEQPHFLHADSLLSPQSSTSPAASQMYRYNPADSTPSIGGALIDATIGAYDQRLLEARADVLCYTTPPLDRAVEIIGTVKLRLYVRSSAASTDFVGRLCDVDTHGRSTNICDGLVRVERGMGSPEPDGSLAVEIDLGATAYHFKAQHQIRLQVASGAHPRWHRNFGTGAPLDDDTTMVIAEQVVYHDQAHPSALVLPIVDHVDS